MNTDKYFRHESGRSAKVVKFGSKYLCVFFDKDQLSSGLNEKFATLKEAKRAINSWLESGLV